MRYLITVDTAETHGVTQALAEAGFPLLGNLFLRRGKRGRDSVVWTVEVVDESTELDAIREALDLAGFNDVSIQPDRRDERDRRKQ
jgi:hypothetical protein